MRSAQEQICCIYCRTIDNQPFPREHVIPQSFGKFKNNFTLHSVCGECNHYFSTVLDLNLARDSGEALLRLRYGIKALPGWAELRNTRINYKIDIPGPWFGVCVLLKPDSTGSKLEAELLPQVGFYKKTIKEWHWLTEDKLIRPGAVDGYRKDTQIKIVGPSDEAIEKLSRKLEDLNVPFKREGTLNQPRSAGDKIETKILYRIDDIILRSTAKIAFNYVAYVEGSSLALRDDFDDVRNYVRYGRAPSWKIVVPTAIPILADDFRSVRQTKGHLIVFDWNRGRQGLVVQLSLFNSVTYHILLCPGYSGLWREFLSGHHFDIETFEISKVIGTKLSSIK